MLLATPAPATDLDASISTDVAAPPAASGPTDWSFMDNTFYDLRGLVTIEDPTRLDSEGGQLGRYDPSDWYLNVSLANTSLRRDHLVTRLVKMREVVVLQSIMASVDYDAWLGRLIKTAGFQLPSYISMKPGQPRVPCRFVFAIPAALRPEDYVAVEFLSKNYGWSPSFQAIVRQLYAVLASKQMDPAAVPSAIIKVKVAPQNVGKERQQTAVKAITETVETMLKFEKSHKPQCDFDPTLPNVPNIHLERIDVDFSEFILSSPMLKDIERLLEIEHVPIGRLTLPGLFGYEPKEVFKMRAPWASFLCSLCGVEGPQNKKILTTKIQELDLPSAYSREDLCYPFMMAMRDAWLRVVQYFSPGSSEQEAQGLKSFSVDLFPPEYERGPELQGSTIMKVLGMVLGDSLESLSVTSGDKATLTSILKNFPALKSLKHSGDMLDSMDMFTEAYQANCQISSLNLGKQDVKCDAMDSFMAHLSGDSKGKEVLQRLRVDSSWQPTAEAVENLFRNNKTLSAIHVSTTTSEPYAALLKHHGQAIARDSSVEPEAADASSEPAKYRSVVVEVSKK